MMETDDKLLRDFFAAEKQEVADDGFSRRVMRQLPDKNHWLIQAWTVLVSLAALTIFFVFDGWQGVISTLRDVFVFLLQNSAQNFDPQSIFIAAGVLLFLGVRKVWSMV
ncbi:MAG: DUF5056 domain-containing protein [Bacteroides sp.]